MLILVLSHIDTSSTDAALLPSDDLAYPSKFLENLSGSQQNIADDQQKSEQRSPVHGQQQQQHLMKLIAMKNSLSDLLTPTQAESLTDPDVDVVDGQLDTQGESNANAIDDRGYGDLQPPADKRVFCNGFTGCGGRFRAQRRHQGEHDADKRVFCNSQGCRNGGRKRAAMAAAAASQDIINDGRSHGQRFNVELWKQALKRLEELQLGKLHKLSKKLFCNYGGCRNVGKRRHLGGAHHRPVFGPVDPEGELVAHNLLPKLDFVSSGEEHSSGKRFFASNADGDLDSLIAALR